MPEPTIPDSATVPVRVRYFAAARQAAGCDEESLDGGGGLAGLVAQLSARGDPLASVLVRCSFLVDGVRRDRTGEPLPEGSLVDVLPAFAGG